MGSSPNISSDFKAMTISDQEKSVLNVKIHGGELHMHESSHEAMQRKPPPAELIRICWFPQGCARHRRGYYSRRQSPGWWRCWQPDCICWDAGMAHLWSSIISGIWLQRPSRQNSGPYLAGVRRKEDKALSEGWAVALVMAKQHSNQTTIKILQRLYWVIIKLLYVTLRF